MSADIYSGIGADDVVTGEAVALDLPPASFGLRAASGLIDVLIQTIALVLLLTIGVAAFADTDEALLMAVIICGVAFVLVGYPTLIETLTRGRTVGHWALGLRTVRDDAGPITFRHALMRSLVAVIEVWGFSGVPALISALVSEKGKRLGDYAAGTYVVRERFAFPHPQPIGMPHALGPWAYSADIAGLPDGLALTVRQFLQRAPSLNPASRWQLAVQLATAVGKYAAPEPPPGTHPEQFLAAVLAERGRRDSLRLQRQAELRRRLVR